MASDVDMLVTAATGGLTILEFARDGQSFAEVTFTGEQIGAFVSVLLQKHMEAALANGARPQKVTAVPEHQAVSVSALAFQRASPTKARLGVRAGLTELVFDIPNDAFEQALSGYRALGKTLPGLPKVN